MSYLYYFIRYLFKGSYLFELEIRHSQNFFVVGERVESTNIITLSIFFSVYNNKYKKKNLRDIFLPKSTYKNNFYYFKKNLIINSRSTKI